MGEEDIVGIVELMLNTDWITENVAKPTIIAQWDEKRVNLRSGDLILIYETSGLSKEQGDLTYSTEDKTGLVSLDIRTVMSKARFNALYTEVERVRKAARKAPHADWDILNFVRRTLFHRPGSWRGVVDYRLEKYNEALD
mgnify:CR=1 FL=1